MVQIALISLFCLTLVAPAMAVGTNGTGTHSRQTGTMTGTSTNNGYGNDLDMNGINNRTNGMGTLFDNDNNGVRTRNTTGGNVRGYATTDTTNDTDWGWLGLLGLLGLAGMFNKGKDRDRSKV
ncbi:MAG: WGxxGxxG family protein [Paenibacillaceae bacterium]